MKEIFVNGMRDIGIPFTEPEGTYFVLADIAPYLKKGQSDVEFCEEMVKKVGVAVVPGSSFFREKVNNIVRLHFAKKDETLYAALERLADIKKKMA
jgi:aminotransferase